MFNLWRNGLAPDYRPTLADIAYLEWYPSIVASARDRDDKAAN